MEINAMNPEDHIQHMLQVIIKQTQSIINDSRKQSFGLLEYFWDIFWSIGMNSNT